MFATIGEKDLHTSSEIGVIHTFIHCIHSVIFIEGMTIRVEKNYEKYEFSMFIHY